MNKIDLADLQRPRLPDLNDPNTPTGYLSLAGCEEWIKDSSKSCKK